MFRCNVLPLVLSASCIFLRHVVSSQVCANGNLATPNLKELVIGKCLEYQSRINIGAFCNQRKDCDDIWQKFSSGFAGQSLCNVSSAGYQNYIDVARHEIPKDKQIFWENVYELVHRYSDKGRRLITLEDTLTGYIADTLRWCGNSSHPDGIVTGSVCPSYDATEECPMSAERAFWLLASRQFAEQATGKITIMLNATSQPIYSPNTYFASYEAPYLRTGIVTDATILLINENEKQPSSSESCKDTSLRSLFTLLENKGIRTTCEENPRDLVFLHCAYNPGSRVCSIANSQTSGANHVQPYSYLSHLKSILWTYCVIATFLYATVTV